MSEMTDENGSRMPGGSTADAGMPLSDGSPASAGFAPTRRRLMLGAASASAVVTIRPALASTAGSVMHCEVPVPDPKFGAGKWIDGRGRVVDAGTAGAYRPPNGPLKAEQIKRAMQGANFPGADYEQSRAYMAYIRKLQNGMSGFTCYQSLQMPRP